MTSRQEYLDSQRTNITSFRLDAVVDRRFGRFHPSKIALETDWQFDRAVFSSLKKELATLRRDYWTSDPKSLKQTLIRLESSPYLEISRFARMLTEIFEFRTQFLEMSRDDRIHPELRKQVLSMATADPKNRFRILGQQLRLLYPNRTADYQEAEREIRFGLGEIQELYPGVYSTLKTVLDELQAYNPEWDIEDDSLYLFYCGYLLFSLSVVGFLSYRLACWIYS